MKNTYRASLCIIASTLSFGGWYFFVYPASERFITTYEKNVHSLIKNNIKSSPSSRACTLQKDSMHSLHNRYSQLLSEHTTHNQKDSLMSAFIDMLEQNNLTLMHYNHLKKEKKEWHTLRNTSVSFEGTLPHIHHFFKQLSESGYTFIPLTVEITTHAPTKTHVTLLFSALFCP